MDQQACGALIRKLRREEGLTQRALAERLGVTDKAVSKWERGMGCPDISLLGALSRTFGVDAKSLLDGALAMERRNGGNMKRTVFYLCPSCGNLMMTTGGGEALCCGRKLAPLSPGIADGEHTPLMERVEDECYLRFPHEMSKEHHLLFVARLGYDQLMLTRLYPEQEAALRLPLPRGEQLLVCCSKHGLMAVQANVVRA